MTNQAPSFGTARDPPPYFAGRRKELKTLRSCLRYIRETSDPRGGMVLIDGVQGVGKTQLLAQFSAEAAGDDHRTTVLNVPVAESVIGCENSVASMTPVVVRSSDLVFGGGSASQIRNVVCAGPRLHDSSRPQTA